MAITLAPIAEDSLTDAASVAKVIKQVLSDLQDQLNENATLLVSTDGVIPAGIPRDTVLIVSYKGRISLYVQGAKNRTLLNAEMLGGLSKQGTQYLGHITKAIAPLVSDFPTEEDWGFYTDTSVPNTFLCLNVNGILRKIAMP